MDQKSKLTHEQGMSFFAALVTLIYNFVKGIKKK